jgi:hypothetical protein
MLPGLVFGQQRVVDTASNFTKPFLNLRVPSRKQGSPHCGDFKNGAASSSLLFPDKAKSSPYRVKKKLAGSKGPRLD